MDIHSVSERAPLLNSGVQKKCLYGASEADTQHTLSVVNVNYNVREYVGQWWKGCCLRSRRLKRVLKNANMHLQSGQITALLGNSGSGKTSFLDVVSCRTSGTVKGQVYLDGEDMTAEIFRNVGGYVMQDDHLLAGLTVRETLTFVTKFKFSGSMKKKDIEERVEKVISDIGLRHVADSRIGGAIIRGISGGEKRRVSIAIQLLQDPKILLLDEPTTGLDSFTAHYLVSSLATLAHTQNRIVLLTIHQPRSDIFKLFDNVGLLSMGEFVYLGPTKELVSYFTGVGYPCPPYANPLDHYVDVASIDRRTKELEVRSHERIAQLSNIFAESSITRKMISQIHYGLRSYGSESSSEDESSGLRVLTFSPPGIFLTLVTLICRMNLSCVRDRSTFIMRNFQLSIMAFFVFLFLNRLKNGQESIQDRTGTFYEAVSVPAYVGLLNGVAVFPMLRDVFYRECRDGLYGSTSFLLAYFLHILPFNCVAAGVFSTVLYWTIGLYPNLDRFGIFYLVVLMMHLSGEILSVTFLGIFRNPAIANSCTALIQTASGLIASGFLRSIQSLLTVFQWMGYATIFKYASEIIVVNEYHGLTLTCEPESSTPCVFTSGDAYLTLFYPEALDNMTRNYAALAGFVGAYALIAMIVFKVLGVTNLR